MLGLYLLAMVLLPLAGFFLARSRAGAVVATHGAAVHSRPNYHGFFTAALGFLPMLAILAFGGPLAAKFAVSSGLSHFPPEQVADATMRGALMRDMISLSRGDHAGGAGDALQAASASYVWTARIGAWLLLALGVAAGAVGAWMSLRRIDVDFRARNHFERIVKYVLLLAATVAVITTIGIVLSVAFETMQFFSKVPPLDFLFGLEWSPQTAMRADQVGSSGAFGIVPLVTGTLLITLIAMLIAGPIGLFAAIYMAEYSSRRVRGIAKPILEILAGVPTVVLGFFAALTVAPIIRELGQAAGLSVASESALAAGLVMGMMIIPFVSSLSDDVINAVPQSLRDGSYALGATRSETIRQVVLPAALPGIVSAMMLAMSRAIGETMIVVMAAGLAANLTFNPLEAVTTFTVQIKTILVGDQEFDSAKTLAAFALGFVLFFFTLFLNVIALNVVKKYREQYD
ncbi:MAG: phosphate ABC transporter permease subunit PstC [Siculibacillus sp.]|nr:phosphate ABC transporter permease subunit PstC [Siculibacillus sp.]